MRKLLLTLQAVIVAWISFPVTAPSQTGRVANGAPKYVFFFLVDGGGATHLEIAASIANTFTTKA